MWHRAFIILIFLAAVCLVSGGAWRIGYGQALGQLNLRAQADMRLASDRLTAQLQRYRELAVYLANHPVVKEIAPQDANREFLRLADSSGARGIYYFDRQGQVLAFSGDLDTTLLAQSPFLRRALNGALGWGHSDAAPVTERAFYYAAPVFDAAGPVQGAVIVAVALDRIEDDWAGSTPAVFFTDRRGRVFISNRSELVTWERRDGQPGLFPPQGQAPPFESYLVGEHEIWQLGWGRYLPENALHLVQDLPLIGLRSEVLMDTSAARRLAWSQAIAVAALCLAFGALLFLATERRRALAEANIQLEARVEERSKALAQAQADLVQAEKLSALGKMSAGISHELNQPLMAIQTYAENAVQFIARDRKDTAKDNLGRISDLATRMAKIIKNFRAFARQESEPATRVDVVATLDGAVDLLTPRLRKMGVQLIYDKPDLPIWVRGGEVRLGQVFVNLITNALDAMAETEMPVLRVLVSDGKTLTVGIRDTGPGIEMPDKVFEPFYSTKAIGAAEGVGLGLSISYGIVQSFGGDIRGTNTRNGALFTVELERWDTKI